MTLAPAARHESLPPTGRGCLGRRRCSCSSAAGASPQITKISMPTLQAGGVTTLIIDGTDLGPNPRLILPVPIAEQTVKDGAHRHQGADRGQARARCRPASTRCGWPATRASPTPSASRSTTAAAAVRGRRSISCRRACKARLAGSATLSTTLAGKKGQRLVVEVEARRLGSAIESGASSCSIRSGCDRPARGAATRLDGDARLVATLPADGTYTIELHDAQFKAGTPNRFRMRVGDFQYADLAFPLAGQRGTKASFQLIGSLPETTRVEADLTALPGRFAGPPARRSGPGRLVAHHPGQRHSRGDRDRPPTRASCRRSTIPAGINGRLVTAKEEDRYRLAVQPGMKLKLERAGRAGRLAARRRADPPQRGRCPARAQRRPADTFDPSLEYTVPEGVTALVAAASRPGGARAAPIYVYRLAVTPAGVPDFSLALLEDDCTCRETGAAVLRIRASRAGYNGPIKLTLPGLPAGVAVSGDEIPAGTTDAFLSLTAPDGRAAGPGGDAACSATARAGRVAAAAGPAAGDALHPRPTLVARRAGGRRHRPGAARHRLGNRPTPTCPSAARPRPR